MMKIDQFARMTKSDRLTAALWLDSFVATMEFYKINTPARQAAFLAQVGHESCGFKMLAENLNYRSDRLCGQFPGRITTEQATLYGRVEKMGRVIKPANQRMLANIVYANRYGNGGIDSGDGWKFRGRGPIQLTFADNFMRCGHEIGVDIVALPQQLEEPPVGAMVAGWFWDRGNPTGRSLNALADLMQFTAIGQKINGGKNGASERLALTAANYKELTA